MPSLRAAIVRAIVSAIRAEHCDELDDVTAAALALAEAVCGAVYSLRDDDVVRLAIIAADSADDLDCPEGDDLAAALDALASALEGQ